MQTSTPRLTPSSDSSSWILTPALSRVAHKTAAPPSASVAPELAKALDQRQFFAELSTLMGNPSGQLPGDADLQLEQACKAFGWMIESALFGAIGTEDQARCHGIVQRINGWLESVRDPVQANRIWSAVLAFKNHLAEVNHCEELVAYDQQMLSWALGKVQSRGMTDDVLERLGSLYGLLPQLNRLLEDAEEVSDETWVAQLRHGLMLVGLSSEEATS